MSSATDLELQHAESLVKWQADLNLLDAEIVDCTAALDEARMDALRRAPDKRPGGLGTEVGELTRKLDGLLKKRDSLARDVQAKKLLLEQLEEDAEAERTERELQESAQAITDATTAQRPQTSRAPFR